MERNPRTAEPFPSATQPSLSALSPSLSKEARAMRSILLMLLGVPLPIILLLAFCTHHF
jgi:hypothetical protein